MEENNVQTAHAETTPNFDGHPTQAHADHAAIMKAHGIINNPERMGAVHALHQNSGGLINYLKKKQKDFSAKEEQQKGVSQNTPASGPSAPISDTGEANGGKSFADTEN